MNEITREMLQALPRSLRAQIDENYCRKDLTQSELGKLQRVVIKVLSAPEFKRQGQRSDLTCTNNVVQVEGPTRRENTTQKVAGLFGESEPTLRRRFAVLDAARDNPCDTHIQELAARMDKTGNVGAAHRALRRQEDEQRVLALQPVAGKYRTILIDPPWDYGSLSLAGRAAPRYAVMAHEELLDMPVPEWAEAECHLYLWTTNNFLPRAMELVRKWGFDYKTILTWVKPSIGLGSYFRNSTEHCLFGVKGKLNTRVKDIPTHFEHPRLAHSVKPDTIYATCERASYPPRLEVFSRQKREGWHQAYE